MGNANVLLDSLKSVDHNTGKLACGQQLGYQHHAMPLIL